MEAETIMLAFGSTAQNNSMAMKIKSAQMMTKYTIG